MTRYKPSDVPQPQYQPPQHYFDVRQNNFAAPSDSRQIQRHQALSSNESQRTKQKLARANFSQLRLTTIAILILATTLTAIAFFSSNWLEAERRYYGSKFRKLGLWRFCFNSFSARDDYTLKRFYVGCRWIFADDYKPIRYFLLPSAFYAHRHKRLLAKVFSPINRIKPFRSLTNSNSSFFTPAFFILTQVLYTAGFFLLIIISAAIIAVQQCFVIEREDYALRALSVASLLSAISCSLAVVIFALYANEDDWMPDPEHNNFSWSFATALLGSLFLWVVALLFYIEMQLVIRKNHRQGSYSHGAR